MSFRQIAWAAGATLLSMFIVNQFSRNEGIVRTVFRG